jgi:flagellar biogenesis protein FliO
VDPIEAAKDIPEVSSRLGEVFKDGWHVAGLELLVIIALCFVIYYLFMRLQESQDKLVDKLDKIERLGDRVTAMAESFTYKAEIATRREDRDRQ